jgi:hypothetical protein
MTDEVKKDGEGTGFSPEYVKELREENASWRIKVRDLEQKLVVNDVQTELMKRGVEADPSWVRMEKGQTVTEAVDSFLVKYPKLTMTEPNPEITQEPKKVAKPMAPAQSKTTNAGPKAGTLFAGKTPKEIKEDPKGRAALRSQYRSLLAQQSNKEYEGD